MGTERKHGSASGEVNFSEDSSSINICGKAKCIISDKTHYAESSVALHSFNPKICKPEHYGT